MMDIEEMCLRIRVLENRVEELENQKKKTPRMIKPTLDDVRWYFKEQGGIESQALDFFEFYESKGWMVGKNPMKKWQLAANKWIRTNNDKAPNNSTSGSANQIRPAAGKYDNLRSVQG